MTKAERERERLARRRPRLSERVIRCARLLRNWQRAEGMDKRENPQA